MRVATLAALAGATDTASFVYSRRQKLRAHPGRLAGSLTSLGIWSGVGVGALRGDRRLASGCAAAALATNAGMLAIHLRAGIANPRVYLGVGLAAAALGASAAGV